MKSDWIEAGKKAANFTLLDHAGTKVKLSQFLGSWVVLYFYPRDNTPGCTREACAFRDAARLLRQRNAVVLGISGDSIKSHEEFHATQKLNFPILSDGDHAVAQEYGAWREKMLYGKKSLGIQRSTFLIDPSGNVAKVWKAVRVDGHCEQVVAALDDFQAVEPQPQRAKK